ncbi:uncharacterized protein LOC123672517 [Harmonia axyridis]|uniref:uncharacterized protein LOC123672517 n=1 Tax=Harmonia axyridis TaxID=115357 RepID=UPI001E275204|nr:uncharacterized protein LOC123672517 [Harmonia axyridis]
MDPVSFSGDDDNIIEFQKNTLKFKKEQEKRWTSFFSKHSVDMNLEPIPSVGIYEVRNDFDSKSEENSSVDQSDEKIERKNNVEVTNVSKKNRKNWFPKKVPTVLRVNDEKTDSLLEQSEEIIESESHEVLENIETIKKNKLPKIIPKVEIIGSDILPGNAIEKSNTNCFIVEQSKGIIETESNDGENVGKENNKTEVCQMISTLTNSYSKGCGYQLKLSDNMSKIAIQKVLVNFIEGDLKSRLGYYFVFLYSSCIQRDKNQDLWRDVFVKEFIKVGKKVNNKDILTYIQRIFDPAKPINSKALIDTIENKYKSELRSYFERAYDSDHSSDEEIWNKIHMEWNRLNKDIPEKCLCVYHRQLFGPISIMNS